METYHGHVRTPADAIILFEACRIGLLPRVQRRLSEKERQSIKSGSVFVWDEREAGMRRWTDGKSWSASRVSGSFLTYREMEGKRGGNHASQASASSRAGKTPDSNRGSDEDQGEAAEEGPDGYRYKPDGLMKQSFSITTSNGQHLHLISYYARSHPTVPGLNQPSSDPALRHIRPQKGLYPESSVNDQQNLPVVTRGPMPGAAFSVPPPPMAHYGRPAVTHPHTYPPSPYTWSQAPMPGQSHVPVMSYVSNYLPPLAPGANGHPPYPYAQHPHMHPPQHPYPPYGTVVHPTDPSMHSHVHPGLHHDAGSTHGVPVYAAGRASGPPPGTYVAGGASHPPGTQVDPRLAGSPAPPQPAPAYETSASMPRVPVTAPTPAENRPYPDNSIPNGHNPEAPSNSSATAVPSINALMNSTPPAPGDADSPKAQGYQPHGTPLTNGHMNGVSAEGPKDIPSDKIGFREDMRALRQLDRVFTAL